MGSLAINIKNNVSATSCPDLKIIFARGSGEERYTDQNYQTFKNELTQKLKLINLKYEFDDLDYPAIGVDNPLTLITTFVSGGEGYEFGESINTGIKSLLSEVNSNVCKNTKYVLAGYSQGAMLISKAINYINPDKLIYVATFGDPKLYLPEGFGPIPAACGNKNLSNYRIYVPDCRVYEGLLGGYKPYQPESLVDKMGTWCNKMDIFCSTHFSINDHTSYVKDGLYADASKLIFDKICQAFGVENKYVSLHDTAILIDSTGSMSFLIDKYKNEALRLAEKTFANGGRVALFDYRDINVENYQPVCHCDFGTCTMENFETKLNEITLGVGGDLPESLLSASFYAMKKLNWRYGATKSVVVLTDASYHNPDIDGVGFEDVVALSKSIDPVNFYIITPEEIIEEYGDLAEATGGRVVDSASNLSVLTDNIMARYDSLPRVEEYFGNFNEILPEISNVLVEYDSNTVRVGFKNTGSYALVILNDAFLGMTEENEFKVVDLNLETNNNLRLVPINKNTRGRGVEIGLGGLGGIKDEDIWVDSIPTPKVPNAGRQ